MSVIFKLLKVQKPIKFCPLLFILEYLSIPIGYILRNHSLAAGS
jgi:hypothetical protein